MISLSGLTKEFGSRTLFSDIVYQFPAGERISLVGPNGAGKTTLLNIICGLESASSGEIIFPNDFCLGYLPQEPNRSPKNTILAECIDGAEQLADLQSRLKIAQSAMETNPENGDAILTYTDLEAKFRTLGGYELEARAKALLIGLGFSQSQFEQDPLDLSGGWRMRLELAKIFINDPDFLVLDEPTNHLDLPSLVWVENYLRDFRGTLVFVSHDRSLLNRLATVTLSIDGEQLREYKGNFDMFLEQKEKQDEFESARKKNLEAKIQHLESFVDRFGAKASKASQAQSRVKMIGRLRREIGGVAVGASDSTVQFKLPPARKSGRSVVRLNDLAMGYNQPLASGVDLEIERQMRVAIVGANGLGKSTLLKTIAGIIPALSGSVEFGHNVDQAYFAQDQLDVLDPESEILDFLMSAHSGLGQAEARKVLGGFLFSDDEVFKRIKVLSGGEKSRVGLAHILVKKANFLLLDEPTNHLDMASIAILSDALEDFAGTIVFVSHDREFINAICTHVFVLADGGRFQLFKGNLDDYVRLAKVADFPNVMRSKTETGHGGKTKTDIDPTKLQRKERRAKIKNLESQIKTLERRVSDAQARVDEAQKALDTTDPTDHGDLQKNTEILQAASLALSEVEDRWLDASEQLEQLKGQT